MKQESKANKSLRPGKKLLAWVMVVPGVKKYLDSGWFLTVKLMGLVDGFNVGLV